MTRYHFDDEALAAAQAMTRIKMVQDTKTKDAIGIIREMLRKIECGEVSVLNLCVRQSGPPAWEGDRMRLDSSFKVELELAARDRRAVVPREQVPATIEVDPAVAQELLECVTVQARDTRNNYRIPARPYSTLLDRIVSFIGKHADRSYFSVRMPYVVYRALVLMGDGGTTPATLLGFKLIVEPADVPQPVFEDKDEDEAVVTDYEAAMGLTRTRTTRKKPKEIEKPKTPAGASAAREIIFDD